MKGLELARKFYEECGRPMLEEQFPQQLDRITVGLAGEGSECLGFDDEISRDHDFEPGFCLFISPADEREFGFKLERAYAKLPKEFMGFRRQSVSPAGGNRHGVLVTDEFYARFLGAPNAPDSLERWLYTSPEMLLSASNGEIWRGVGSFMQVRQTLLEGYPEDVRLKKIAAHSALAAQAGQYNFARLIDRGETGAAQLAVFEFVKHVISIIYLLNRRYEPFYKWAYRGMRELPLLGDLESTLADMTLEHNSPDGATRKARAIDEIAGRLTDEFRAQKMTKADCRNLDTNAFSVNDCIKDGNLRNMHIMSGA